MQVHKLFVIVGGSDEATAATVRILQFVAHCKPWLNQMRIALKVEKIRAALLTRDVLRKALTAQGLTEFPALKTPNRRYLGVSKIAGVYSVAIQDFKKSQKGMTRTQVADARRGIEIEGAASADDIYRNFYANELTFKAAESDHGDTSLGDKDNMMSQFQDMVKRRSEAQERRKGQRNPYISETGTHPQRPQSDNVADDGLIDRLIATATAPVTQSTLDKAFGDCSGAEDSREDVMLAAFWENQTESM